MRRIAGAFVVTLAATTALAASGCAVDQGYLDNEIVFGIEQAIDPATGEVTTNAGYEMLELGSKGWITEGYSDGARSCWLEALDDRLGQPRVDGGEATFRGGLLPDSGLVVAANQPDATLNGAGWQTGDALTFGARGFAAPPVGPFAFQAPRAELTITAPGDGPVSASPSHDLRVTWDVTNDDRDMVLVALESDSKPGSGVELRCFFDVGAGEGVVPKEQIARFADAAQGARRDTPRDVPPGVIAGTFLVATHRQLTVYAHAGWTFYVVASALQRRTPLSLTPP